MTASSIQVLRLLHSISRPPLRRVVLVWHHNIVTTANGDTLGRGSLPVAQQACVAAAPTTGSTTHMSGGVATEVSTSQTVASTGMNFGVFASIGALFTVFGFVAARKR